MRRRCIGSIVILLLITASGAAQSRGTPAPTGPTPRTPDGKVDFSGVWSPGTSFATLGQVPLQPWAEALRLERRASLSKDDLIDIQGTVVAVHSGGLYRVQVDAGHEVLAQLSGRMRRFRIKVVPGDRVTVGVSPYDPVRGIITFRAR